MMTDKMDKELIGTPLENENIDPLFRIWGFYNFKKDDQIAIGRYGYYLLKNYKNGKYGEPIESEYFEFFSAYAVFEMPDNTFRSEIIDRVKGHITVSQVPCMIATYSTKSAFSFISNAQFEALQAWMLVLFLELDHGQKSSKSVVKLAASRVRIFTSDLRWEWLYKKLPLFSGSSNFEELHDHFESLHDDYQGEEGETQVDQLFKVFRDFVNKEHKAATEQGRRSVLKKKGIKRIKTTAFGDDESVKIQTLLGPANAKMSNAITHKEEQVCDAASGHELLEVEEERQYFNLDRTSQAINAQNRINAIARAEKQSNSEWQTLTDFEVACFIKQACKSHEPISALLLFSLLTACSLPQGKRLFEKGHVKKVRLNSSKITLNYKNHQLLLTRYPELPKHIGSHQDDSVYFINPVSDFFMLPMPKVMADKYHLFKKSFSSELYDDETLNKTANEFLRQINDEFYTRLTPLRINQHLHQMINKIDSDSANAALICGLEASQCTALYYYNIEESKLLNVYQKALQHMSEATDIDLTFSFKTTENTGVATKHQAQNKMTVGDKLNINVNKIRIFYQKMAQSLNDIRSHPKMNILEFHNYYLLYTYLVLALATGHRPTSTAFALQDDFDLSRGIVWISDKESRAGLAARSVPLVTVAQQQYQYFLEHLKKLSIYINCHSSVSNQEANMVNDMFESRALIIQSFDHNDELCRLKPKIMYQMLKGKWELPLNWNRHVLRTELPNYGLDSQMLDFLMGHARNGAEGQGRWSGLASQDFRQLENGLNQFMQDLNIQAVRGMQS